MWCERVVRNVAGDGQDLTGRQIDPIDVEWDECKSVLKKRTRGRELVNVLLPRSQQLRHGDILFEDDRRAVVINVVATPMVVVKLPDARSLAVLALELGNLHWPAQISTDEIMFPQSDAPLDVVKALGYPWTIETRRFAPQVLVAEPAVHLSGEIQVIRAPATNV